MHVVALAWIYVALMMTAAEIVHPNGTWLGALFTFLMYGVLPVSIVLYILGTPARRRARLKREQAEALAASLAPETNLPSDPSATAAAASTSSLPTSVKD